jgi:hypothetical protein
VPRRAAPPDPEAGPLEGFAAKLRDLRDRAGAPSIPKISSASGLPRSSVYAILSGKRVPSEETLAALVDACGGDSAEWLAKRSLLLEALANRSDEPTEVRSLARTSLRTVLVVVRDHQSIDSVLAAIAPIETDHHVQILFTVDQQSPLRPRTYERLSELGALVLPWRQATTNQFDLILATHSSDSLKELHGPLLSLARNDDYQPSNVAPQIVTAGDLLHEQMLASVKLRSRYRRALGVQPHQQLVQLSSAWGPNSLMGERPDLPIHLLASLPTDQYKVALMLHPNIWNAYGKRQVESWLQSAVESGLLLVHPDDWRSTLIASDVLIGDHGSVTNYASALGIPIINADEKSPLDVTNAVNELRGPGFHKVVPDEGGRAVRRLRAQMYELLGLTEPPCRTVLRALEAPAHTQVKQPTSFRVLTLKTCDVDVQLERYPLVPGIPGEQGFIVATDQERNLAVMNNAEVVVATKPSPHMEAESVTEELLAMNTGAALAAAGSESWLVLRSERPSCIKATAAVTDTSKGFVPDPVLIAAAAYRWLQQSQQGDHCDLRVQTGVHKFTIELKCTDLSPSDEGYPP